LRDKGRNRKNVHKKQRKKGRDGEKVCVKEKDGKKVGERDGEKGFV
jgi:hypothetical protein